MSNLTRMRDDTLREQIESLEWLLNDPDAYRFGPDAIERHEQRLRALRSERRRRGRERAGTRRNAGAVYRH